MTDRNNLRNRRDHYVPQSYLRGFTDPERTTSPRPLWYFDIPGRVWTERSPREIAYRYGFYDYMMHQIETETADSSFVELENLYPHIRSALIEDEFQNWKEYLEFLLCYGQMMRARSLLFFENHQTEGKNLRAWTVEEISQDRQTIKLKSMTPETLPPSFVKNWTITKMREEIQKGPAWLNDFRWAIRYCQSTANPFVVSEAPLMICGEHPDLESAIWAPHSLLFFPLCWQATLVGSRQAIAPEIGEFGDEDMLRFRKMYESTAKIFIVSPQRLSF